MRKVNIVLDKYLQQNYQDNNTNYRAARNIKELLTQIDLDAEVVPENNREMLSRLIGSLKNEELTIAEKIIIEEIVQIR